MESIHPTPPISKTRLWAGRSISALVILFLLFDGITKVMLMPQVVAASEPLGYPVDLLPAIGGLLILLTVVYAIPQTAPLGAILLTGYLGGAIASKARIGQLFWFEIMFGALVWAGILLRESRLWGLFYLRRVPRSVGPNPSPAPPSSEPLPAH
jgi:hypothetical protein